MQVNQIKENWSEYFVNAIAEVRDRFEQIESASFLKNMEEQKAENDKIDIELSQITGQV